MSSVVSGAILVVAMRWSGRLIGFVSTLVLARLLVPEDFGLVAMVSVLIGLADTLFDLGTGIALVQNKSPTRAHYDTAWTLGWIQSLIGMLVVMAAAPYAADYFHEPRVRNLAMVMALTFPLSAAANIGVVTFQKEMRFEREFQLFFAVRVFSFVVTLVAAWLMRSYWALVIGTLAGRVCNAVLSYVMHPMRPRLSLEKFAEIFGFSQWMLLRSILHFLDNRLHVAVVGNRAEAAVVGTYSLADEVASLPTTELLAPLNRVLFPAFVQVKDNLSELKRTFLLSQSIQAAIGIPTGVGIALVANEAVPLLLGDKWLAAIPFLQVMAMANVISAIAVSATYVLYALGRARMLAFYSVFQVMLFIVGAFVFMPAAGAMGLTWLRLGVAAAGLFSIFYLAGRLLPSLRLGELIAGSYRPLLSAGIMVLCVHNLGVLTGLTGVVLMSLKIGVGALSYGAAMMLLWRVAGLPKGAEEYMLRKGREFIASRRRPA